MTSKSSCLSNRICLYQNDGSGRDSYISSNNAGFYKEYRIIKTSEGSPENSRRLKSMYNPVFSKPIGKYFCDGKGRDVYIFKQNTRNLNSTSGGLDLPNILRNDDCVISGAKNDRQNPDIKDKIKSSHNKIIAKNLIRRIFYGDVKGIPERKMSPKVKFNKKRIFIQDRGDLNERISEKDRFAYYYKTKYAITEENFIKGIKTIANFNCRYKY